MLDLGSTTFGNSADPGISAWQSAAGNDIPQQIYNNTAQSTAAYAAIPDDRTSVLAEVFSAGVDEAQIKQKHLLVEQYKSVLNGLCGSFTRWEEKTRQKHIEERKELCRKFEDLKKRIISSETFYTRSLQKIEMEINNVHQISKFIEEASQMKNYADAFDVEIPDTPWLQRLLENSRQDQEPWWLLIRSRVKHWNRVAQLSRKTPRIPAQVVLPQTEDFTICNIVDPGVPGCSDITPAPPVYDQSQTTFHNSAMISSSNKSVHLNSLVPNPTPFQVESAMTEQPGSSISNDRFSYNSSLNYNFTEETAETWDAGSQPVIALNPIGNSVAQPPSQESFPESLQSTPHHPGPGRIMTRELMPPSSPASTSALTNRLTGQDTTPTGALVAVTPTTPTPNGSGLSSYTSLTPAAVGVGEASSWCSDSNRGVQNHAQSSIPAPFFREISDEPCFQPPAPKRNKPLPPTTQIIEHQRTFGGIKLKRSLIAGLIANGYVEPLRQQQEGIQRILEGSDVILNCSKGKTSSAIIGVLQTISETIETPQAIILYPLTKDAQKAHKLCSEISSLMSVKSVLLISEDTLRHHQIQNSNFAQVIFTTPWFLHKVQLLNPQIFSTAKLLVLDGAKKLLEFNSFHSVILKIIFQLNRETQIVVLTHGKSARLSSLINQVMRSPIEINDQIGFNHSECGTEVQISDSQSPASSSSAFSDSDTSRDGFVGITREDTSESGIITDLDQSDRGSGSDLENLSSEDLNNEIMVLESTYRPETSPGTCSTSNSNDVEVVHDTGNAQTDLNLTSVEHYYIECEFDAEKLDCLRAVEQKMIEEQAIIVCNSLKKAVWLFQKLNSMKLECHMMLDDHLELKAEVMSRFRSGSIRIIILTHDMLSRSKNMLKKVTFLFNYDFPLDAEMYRERVSYTGFEDSSAVGDDGAEINVFSFLTKSNIDIVQTLRSTHQIHLKNFQNEGCS